MTLSSLGLVTATIAYDILHQASVVPEDTVRHVAQVLATIC